ncbi:hypothetical protein [Sphingomonas oryzagri]
MLPDLDERSGHGGHALDRTWIFSDTERGLTSGYAHILKILVALAAALLVGSFSAPWMQVFAIILGAALGLLICREHAEPARAPTGVMSDRLVAWACLAVFGVLLASSLLLEGGPNGGLTGLGATFFRARRARLRR